MTGTLDPKKIEAQAKAIMDGFLDEIQGSERAEIGLRREQQTRDGAPTQTDEQFRQALYANARSIDSKKVNDKGEIVMERKQW
jgi:hypothetical protein